ncbi:MAG: hypothetical protein WCK63_14120 [Betaproteobacteria bacterium]
MKTRRLLYLCAHHLNAFQWNSSTLTQEVIFEATESGLKEFSSYLSAHPESIYSILTNVAEEGFQLDSIPVLRGADRQAILERKLSQLFFNVELTAALSLGYQKTQRKNERVMLAALTNSDFFIPWLECLVNSGVALSGIYSLPFLTATLLKKLRLVEDQCLLLTVQDQSIRQSYLEKGELHFSRLTPLPSSSISGIAQSFSSEAHKLQQYLASQRLVGRDQPITAHLLAHPSAFKAIQNSCIDSGTIHFNLLNIEECASRIGLKSPPQSTHSETLFLHLLATSPPRTQFANDHLRHDYHLLQIRTALLGFGALVLIASLLLSGKLLLDNHRITQETRSQQSETVQIRQRYEEIVKTLPPIPVTHETLHRVIDRYLELNRKNVSPRSLYHEISRALRTVPSAELDSIDWKTGSAEPLSAMAPNPASMVTATSNGNESALVRGTINLGTNATPRQMLDVFNQLVEALKSNPKIQVEILKRPFDIESGKPLKGGGTTVEDNKPRSFSLQVFRKIEP